AGALRAAERGVAARGEAVEPLREAELREVCPEPLPKHVVDALLTDAVRLHADGAAGGQELIVDKRLRDDEGTSGAGRSSDAPEAREPLPLAVHRRLHGPAVDGAGAEAGLARAAGEARRRPAVGVGR